MSRHQLRERFRGLQMPASVITLLRNECPRSAAGYVHLRQVSAPVLPCDAGCGGWRCPCPILESLGVDDRYNRWARGEALAYRIACKLPLVHSRASTLDRIVYEFRGLRPRGSPQGFP